jgi:hypothetical protein
MAAVCGKHSASLSSSIAARRREALLAEGARDANHLHLRYPDPNVCPRCEVVFCEGRWRWTLRPAGSFGVLCPACSRVEDAYPAEIVTLAGPFLATHRGEILDLVHDEEIAERDEHPLNRLMALEEGGGAIVATTTATQLAQRIADVLSAEYGGDLQVRYSDDDTQVRVRWSR